MSGVAGIINSGSTDKNFLDRLLIHKPDNGKKGYYTDKGMGIMQNVLETDFNKDEKFPLVDEELVCFVDGIIYNYEDLKGILEKKGYKFKTSGKFEIVPHLYREFGKDFFTYLNGKFAIILWNSKNKELVIGVDKNSQKLIYYTQTKEGIIFSSQIKGILNSKLINAEPNWQQIYNYLSYPNIYGEETLFKGIKKIVGGTYISLKDNTLKSQTYNRSFPKKSFFNRSFKENHKQILSDAINRVCMEDKKTGVQLSGGMDSTAIAYLAKENGSKINAYSIGYEGFEDSGDSYYAREVARILDIDLKQKIINSKEIETMNDLIKINELGINPKGMWPAFNCSKIARSKEKVLLNGGGSDFRYGKTDADKIISKLRLLQLATPKFSKRFILSKTDHFYTKNMKAFELLYSKNNIDMRIKLFKGFLDSEKENILENSQYVKTSDYIKNIYQKLNIDEEFNYFIFDMSILMTKHKTHASYNSLEMSYPFLDSEFISLMKATPNFQKSFLSAKSSLKKILVPKFPKQILNRKKEGFIPPNKWFPERKEFLYSKLDDLSKRKGFDGKGIERLKDSKNTTNYWNKILVLAIIESWFEVFIDNQN